MFPVKITNSLFFETTHPFLINLIKKKNVDKTRFSSTLYAISRTSTKIRKIESPFKNFQFFSINSTPKASKEIWEREREENSDYRAISYVINIGDYSPRKSRASGGNSVGGSNSMGCVIKGCERKLRARES